MGDDAPGTTTVTAAGAPPPEAPWWRQLWGVPVVVALEIPLVLVLASANDLSATQAALTVLVISGGTTVASGAAWLLRREEERAERMARAIADQERTESAR
jgi:hypothetical protein